LVFSGALQINRIVEVASVEGIDRNDVVTAAILAALQISIGDFCAETSYFVQDILGESQW